MNKQLTKHELSKIYGRVSPFEFKDKLISLAKLNSEKFNGTVLDAGRGNPNWTASTPRQAFFTFGQFAVQETQRTWSKEDLAGMIEKQGIAERLLEYLKLNSTAPGIELLEKIFEYGVHTLNFDADSWVFELADGIIGGNYPFPDKMLIHIEKVVHDYLIKELCMNKTFDNKFDVFAVEGGTAAMCYIFDSLAANGLLKTGDKIALMTPIFTPYLEIPHLPNYKFEVVNIHAKEIYENGNQSFYYPEKELDKLKDTDVKVLFVVNPNNPISLALDNKCKEYLIDIVDNYNKDLMIITDDVYCTFVDNFCSLIAELPYNTLGVYSLSKYFGVTGWRLGAIMLNEHNVFNKLISELPKEDRDNLNERYKHLSFKPENLSFMERMVADSRQVALNHTAGLSTPQQVQMAFFCAFSLIDRENRYKFLTKDICRSRKKLLFDGLELTLINDPSDASYYTELNFLDLAESKHGEEFAKFIKETYKPLDILYRLSEEYAIILLNGDGFNSSPWSLRISLANLPDKAYYIIGRVMKEIIDAISLKWKAENNLELYV